MSTSSERAALLRRLDAVESIFKQYGFAELSDEQFLGVVAILAGRADLATYEACLRQPLEDRRDEVTGDALRERQRRFFNRTNDNLPERSRFITAAIASYFPSEDVPPQLVAELHARAHSSHARERNDARFELAVLRTDDAIELRTQFHAFFIAWLDPLVEEYESADWAEFQRAMRARHYGYAYEPIMDEHERRLGRRHHPRPWDPIDKSQPEREEPSAQQIALVGQPRSTPRAGWLTTPQTPDASA
jgi:hypothetical protein